MRSIAPVILWITLHLVIPGAIVLMVTSLLFFLIDLRSVFWVGGESLKGAGGCFVLATVLIVRYGRIYGVEARTGPYLAALLLVTLLSISSLPGATGALWGETSYRMSIFVNALIMASIWWFASAVTHQLSLEDGDEAVPAWPARSKGGQKGLSRLESLGQWFAALQRLDWVSGGDEEPDARGNPSAGIARLAVAAMVVFAVGEPVLMKGAPELGAQALAAVYAYFFAVGLLLAAGSSVGVLRYVSSRGGSVGLGLIPLRVGMAAVVLVGVLTAGLAVPGVQFRGGAQIRSRLPLLQARPLFGPGIEARPEGLGPALGGDNARRALPLGAAPGGATLIALLTGWGERLLVPLAAGVGLVCLAALLRLRGAWFGGLSGLGRLFSQMLGRALGGLVGRWRPARAPEGSAHDPWTGWEALAELPPGEAVLAAYGRFLNVAAFLGHPRPPRHTPVEFLRQLPLELRPAWEAARDLTELYLRAAYSPVGVGVRERERAIEALGVLRVRTGTG